MIYLRLSGLLARAVTRFAAPTLVATVVALLPFVAYAGTITVDGATCTLPDAITAANVDAVTDGCTAGSGADMLLLTAGIYSLATGPFDHNGLTATPSITTTIVISGGVDGATIERSGSEQYRLFYVGETGDLTLEHLVLRNGDVLGYGGAIYNLGELTVVESQIVLNKAYEGGGIYNFGATATLIDSAVIANSATERGGGIFSHDSTSDITFSDVISNTAYSGGGIHSNVGSTTTFSYSNVVANRATNGSGGGIYNQGALTLLDSQVSSNSSYTGEYSCCGGGAIYNQGSLTLSNSDIVSNNAFFGGGVYNDHGSTATLTGSNIISNIATFGTGGGIYNSGGLILVNSDIIANGANRENSGGAGIHSYGTATVEDSDFISNTTGFRGGGFHNSYGTATFIDSNFIANSAKEYGGGIDNVGGTVTLTNSNFITNLANYGGAIYNSSFFDISSGFVTGTISLANSEVQANIALLSGGGIYQLEGKATIVRTRFLDNLASYAGGALYTRSGDTSITQSCIVGNSGVSIFHEIFNPGDDALNASNNWWGAPDGPSGSASGAGDSVSSNVTFEPFLVVGCPTLPTPRIEVSKKASRTQASVGETITYTYRITNTGNVTLTSISATDNKLGAVGALAGQLLPNVTRSATLTYVVQASDLPGPLVNTVTVTGTDSFGTVVTDNASASLSMLRTEEQPPQLYLPHVEH